MKKLLSLGLLFGALTLQAAEEFVPIQEKAQGQSLAGSTQLNDSLYSNPAASSFINVYSVEGSLSMPKGFSASVLDTKTSVLGGAIGYFRKEVGNNYYNSGIKPETGQKYLQGAKMALMGKISNSIGVGVSGKSVWGPNVAGKSDRLNDADVGMIFNGGFFQLGTAIRNVLGGKELMNLPREYTFGGRISYDQILSLSVATQSKFNSVSPYQYGVGFEYVSPFYFAIRGGYRTLVQERENFWSLGASFVSPRLSLHYAVEMPNQPNSPVEHTLGTTLLF